MRQSGGWEPGDDGRRPEGGFTLIEVLIVVFILGLIATILTINVGTTLKKQRLETAAKQLGSFLKNAQMGASERSRGAFVVITPPDGNGQRTVWMVSDTNQDDALGFDPDNPQAGPDMPLPGGQMFLTADIGLQPDDAIPGGANQWPVIAGNYVLLCDPRGYPFNSAAAPATQITTPVSISITHAEMLSGSLHPRFRYDVTVSPLWTISVDRVGY